MQNYPARKELKVKFQFPAQKQKKKKKKKKKIWFYCSKNIKKNMPITSKIKDVT